jgi:hypothetical protein
MSSDDMKISTTDENLFKLIEIIKKLVIFFTFRNSDTDLNINFIRNE